MNIIETKKDHNKHSKRIVSNTLVLFARMLIITIVNLYTVRWVLNGLGTEDYGIFNAIAGVVTASICISSVLALSTQRFYSYAMGQGNSKRLKEIFSASLNITILLSIFIIIVFEIVGPWFINNQLTISANRIDTALVVFQFSLFSFVCTLIQIPFIGAVFANEDMSIYALISTIDCFSKLIIAYMIGHTPFDNLIFYSAALMIEALLVLSFYVIIANLKYKECKHIRIEDKSLYKELLSFSGWTFYGTISSMGMTQGSIILLNIFFGPLTNAAFNIANQIYNALNTLANSINIAIRPSMIKAYSGKDQIYLNQLFVVANKALLYLLAAVSIPLAFEMDTILHFWLGTYTNEMALFSLLYIVFTIILCLHNPITTIIQATGHIKNYTIFVESLTILNVPICWGVFKLGYPSYTIFIVMISLCILAHVMRLIMLKKSKIGFSYTDYVMHFLLPGIIVIVINIIFIHGIRIIIPDGLIKTCITLVISPLILVVLAYIIGLNKAERNTIQNFIIKK